MNETEENTIPTTTAADVSDNADAADLPPPPEPLKQQLEQNNTKAPNKCLSVKGNPTTE